MRFTTLSLAVLATTTSSVLADEIVSLFLPMVDEQAIDAKVIGTKGAVTSYVLYCPQDTPSESCGLPQEGFTMAQGGSSYAMAYSYNDYYATQDCIFKNKSVISCKVTMSDATTTQMTEAAITTDHMPFYPVTVTATEGVEKTSATKAATTKDTPSNTAASATATASSTGSVSRTSTSASASASTSAPASSTMEAATSSAGVSSAAASQTISGNAAAVATGAAQWVVAGGAAMGVVLALV